jgi:hypothetical protein
VTIDRLQLRALVNGGIAAAVTLAIGLGVVAGVTADDEEPPPVAPSTTPTPPPSPPCTPVFEIAQSADPADLPSWLNDVTALSAAEAWAVGAAGDPEAPLTTLVERWDGIAWTAEEGPSPGSELNELLAVDASGPNDVWAVGRTASGFGDRPLAIRFDGTSWLEVALPDGVTGILTGVAAIAPNDVWVVGHAGDPAASLEHALILHWDGQLWADVDAGRAVGVGTSALFDVEAVAPDDVWAAGYLHNKALMIHFDGQAWARTETATRGATNAIAPVSTTDAWAAGGGIERFDGQTWTDAEAPVRTDGELFGVAAISPSDVWAVGRRPVGDLGLTKSLVLRFDGRRWTPVTGPVVPGSDALTGIDALPDGTVLAVGYKDVEAGRRTLGILGTTCFPEA